MKKSTTHNLTVAAMLSAVAFILMFIEFPIPMLIPSFVKMDFSDLPALLAHRYQGHFHCMRGRAVQLHAGCGFLRCGRRYL